MATTIGGGLLLVVVGPVLVETASAAPDPNETVVTVRKDCGTPAPDNCFETLNAAENWAFGNSPSPSHRLVVDIGPGDWPEDLYCNDSGYVTFRGAGREATVISGSGNQPVATIEGRNCHGLEVKDLKVTGPSAAVTWTLEGSSTWTNVDLVGLGTSTSVAGSWGWKDDYCSQQPLMDEVPVHYFFGSRLSATNANINNAAFGDSAFYGACSDVWFFGGELSFFSDGGLVKGDAGVYIARNSRFRAYGSLVRAVVREGASLHKGRLIGVLVDDTDVGGGLFVDPFPGQFHMHGGIINVTVPLGVTIGSFPKTEAVGVSVEDWGPRAHTLDTAFILNTPDALESHRVQGGEAAASPMLWQTGSKPPLASTETNRILSSNGQDLWVETDCAADGDCNGGGVEAHLMVYNDSLCTDEGNPWFDTVTARCRNDVATPVIDLDDRVTTLEAQVADFEARISALENP